MTNSKRAFNKPIESHASQFTLSKSYQTCESHGLVTNNSLHLLKCLERRFTGKSSHLVSQILILQQWCFINNTEQDTSSFLRMIFAKKLRRAVVAEIRNQKTLPNSVSLLTTKTETRKSKCCSGIFFSRRLILFYMTGAKDTFVVEPCVWWRRCGDMINVSNDSGRG